MLAQLGKLSCHVVEALAARDVAIALEWHVAFVHEFVGLLEAFPEQPVDGAGDLFCRHSCSPPCHPA